MPPASDRKPGLPESRQLDADGKLVRFVTRTHGVTVYRQGFKARDGSRTFSSSFYLQKQVAGEIERFPLGIDAKEAERLAEEIAAFVSIPMNTLDMARAKYNPRAIQRETKYATIGDVLDTNTNWLCTRVTGLGGLVRRTVMLRDDIDKEMGDADDENAEVIDQKMWDDEDEKEEDDGGGDVM